ncbi:MAG: hypothetical protein NT157_04905 [Candidatus Micrarchaeota archaeon]|nr:hypothetical protein [Candidatus Micrarchaeota archaeon]
MNAFEKANADPDAVFEKLRSIGAPEVDANLVVSSILQDKTCMWMNNDPMPVEKANEINAYLASFGFEIYVKISPVPGREHLIWETKRKRQA